MKKLPNASDLINTLNSTIYRTSFYAKCVEYLKSLGDKEMVISIIEPTAYLLEPLRLYFINGNMPEYLYLASELEDTDSYAYSYRVLSLTEKSQDALLRQINAIRLTSMNGLCKDPEESETSSEATASSSFSADNLIKYFIISAVKINNVDYFRIPSNYATLSLLLGIKSLDILRHQNLDRFCGYINSSNKTIQKELKPLFDFYKFHNDLTTIEKERILVFSGSVLTILGTVYTNDVDLMYIALGENHNEIESFKRKIKTNKDYDAHLIFKDRIEKTSSSKVRGYLFDWFTRGWPQMDGANNIFDVVADPRHHFHFMGIKFISLELTIKRIQKRAYASSYVDLIMLEKFNDYTEAKICFPNLSIREGVVSIYDDKLIDTKLKKIQQYLKEWHQVDMTYDELKSKIFKCRDKPFEIYDTRPLRYHYTSDIITYHTQIMNYYIDHYFDKSKLLDVGAGPLRQVEYYESIGIKHLVAIEPSKQSIITGKERYEQKTKKIMKLDFVEGVGDEPWMGNDPVYEPVRSNAPYKSILFKFTIHYMIKNLNILLDNLAAVIEPDTTVIISCIDGTKLMEKMKDKKKYEIYLGDDPLYGVYDFPSKDDTENYKQIMIYFKGVYGVESGSIEYIVDINYLINKFKSIGFEVVLSKNFMDIDVPQVKKYREKFNEAQRKVSELHHLLILKTGSGNVVNKGGYKYKYLKYKTKYLDYISNHGN